MFFEYANDSNLLALTAEVTMTAEARLLRDWWEILQVEEAWVTEEVEVEV